MTMYEAVALDGRTVKGELVYELFNMYILIDKGYAKEKVACIPGTEKELKDGQA